MVRFRKVNFSSSLQITCFFIHIGILIFTFLLNSLIDNVEVVQWLSDHIKVAKQDVIDYGNALGSNAFNP